MDGASIFDRYDADRVRSEAWGAKLRLLELARHPARLLNTPEVREQLDGCRAALAALETINKGEKE